MRTENNFVQVENNPTVINKVNNVAAAFGWTVQSIQVTDSAVAYESGAVGWTTEFGTFVNKTISINRTTYASITYQRDRDDPKYREWVELETEYNDMLGKSFLNEQEQEKSDVIWKEAEAKVRRNYQALMMIGKCFFYGMALMDIVVMFMEPEMILVMGIGALFFACMGYFLYDRWMKKELAKEVERLTTRSLSKNSEYARLMQIDASRRDQARTEILNRARAI